MLNAHMQHHTAWHAMRSHPPLLTTQTISGRHMGLFDKQNMV